jgi:hypothetical protein
VPEPKDPIAALEERVRHLEKRMGQLEQGVAEMRTLTGGNRGANIRSMQPVARVNVAKSKSDGDILSTIANAAGHTIRSLAKAVGCSQTLLSLARDGQRSISNDLALKVQAVTRSSQYPRGFEPDLWPSLRRQA